MRQPPPKRPPVEKKPKSLTEAQKATRELKDLYRRMCRKARSEAHPDPAAYPTSLKDLARGSKEGREWLARKR